MLNRARHKEIGMAPSSLFTYPPKRTKKVMETINTHSMILKIEEKKHGQKPLIIQLSSAVIDV
jgi:hypothetical protein